VKFVNTLSGWAVGGTSGHVDILHTGNGGKTWTRQGVPGMSRLLAVDFVSSKIGWVLARDSGDHACILSTTEGAPTGRRTRCPGRYRTRLS
jgi:photosystem II stability/assembly factor-like uncharacterized protein